MHHKSLDVKAYKNIADQVQVNIRNLQNFQFLIEATSLMSTSHDYKLTLRELAHLAVPAFADWCSIHLATQDYKNQQIVVHHADPRKIKLVESLQRDYPQNPDATTGVSQVIRTGKSEIITEIPEKLLIQSALNKKHLKIIMELGLRSYMCVPVLARGKVLGAITFVSAESGRLYTEDDLALVEDLARIAGIAIDNALLFKEAQDEILKRKEVEKQIVELNKGLEDRVIARTKELQRSNRELQDFAYVASHDLQEPLRKIQAFGDLLLEEYGNVLDENAHSYIDRMLNAASRMRILINDLLSFSRVSTKALPFIQVNLSQIVQDVLIDLESQIASLKGKVIVKNLSTINADPMQMRQLFQNLISNSLKFHRKDISPLVEIYEQKNGNSEMVNVVIKDNGIGLDTKYKDRIFTIFERLHGKHDYDGTGIGLAVVRKIVERHNGTIAVESKPGYGAKFLITLPKGIQKGVIVDG